MLPGGEHFGEERLRALVERAGGGRRRARRRARGASSPQLRLRDDVALLAIRCPGPPALLARGTLDGDGRAAARARRCPAGPDAPARGAAGARARRSAGAWPSGSSGDALIVVSELVTNADPPRRRAARPSDERRRRRGAAATRLLRVEVTDPGPGFEPGGHGPRADGGYGLHLLDRLATRWGVAGAEPVTVWVELSR